MKKRLLYIGVILLYVITGIFVLTFVLIWPVIWFFTGIGYFKLVKFNYDMINKIMDKYNLWSVA